MLELSNLKPEQLRQVYEWDGASAIESFDHYAARLTKGDWAHYSINDGADFIGCISLELLDPTTASIHLAMKAGSSNVQERRRVLINIGILLFNSGVQTLICEVMPDNAKAQRLVESCGMTAPDELQNGYRRFQLTAEEYKQNPQKWN